MPDVAITIKQTLVIERIVNNHRYYTENILLCNNALPVKPRANLHPFQFGIETAKFNHVISHAVPSLPLISRSRSPSPPGVIEMRVSPGKMFPAHVSLEMRVSHQWYMFPPHKFH